MLKERLKQLSEGVEPQAPQGRLQTRLRERAEGETLAQQLNNAFRSEANSTREALSLEMREAVAELVKEEVAQIRVRDGKDGRSGLDGKTPSKERLLNLINSVLPKQEVKKLSIEDIEELRLLLDNLSQRISRAGGKRGGGGGDVITLSTKDNTISGSFPGTQFTLSRDLKNAVVFARGSRKTLAEDYTKSGLVITFLVSQPAGPITVDGQSL